MTQNNFLYFIFFILNLSIKIFSIQNLSSWVHIQDISSIFSIIFILSITNHYMTYNILYLWYSIWVLNLWYHRSWIQTSKATKQHQWSIVILMMIQQIPCIQALVCHAVVESDLYFSYASVLLNCINIVMTSKYVVNLYW